VVHWFESGAGRFAGACSPRGHGLTASRFGRYQPVVYVRHYVRVLLNRWMPFVSPSGGDRAGLSAGLYCPSAYLTFRHCSRRP
jgi:hypothetical protein